MKNPQRKVQTLIITGTSGSGKSSALKALEDIGYFCVDNLPIALLHEFLLLKENVSYETNRVAIVMDIREKDFLLSYKETFKEIRDQGFHLEILFLDAKEDVLLRRYSQTRRAHPMAKDIELKKAIELEKKLFEEIREYADIYLDTSDLNPHQLRETIFKIFSNRSTLDSMQLHIVSFGFKYGVPADLNLLFDVRFLPNPYFIPELKPLSGKHEPIKEFILKEDTTKDFLQKIETLLNFLIPQYKKEGKSYLVIGIGCTGGYHRSVVISEYLFQALSKNHPNISISHRDIEKGD